MDPCHDAPPGPGRPPPADHPRLPVPLRPARRVRGVLRPVPLRQRRRADLRGPDAFPVRGLRRTGRAVPAPHLDPETRPPGVDFDPAMRWVRLEILDTTEGSAFHSTGTVTFRAHYTDDGRPDSLHEKSRFVGTRVPGSTRRRSSSTEPGRTGAGARIRPCAARRRPGLTRTRGEPRSRTPQNRYPAARARPYDPRMDEDAKPYAARERFWRAATSPSPRWSPMTPS